MLDLENGKRREDEMSKRKRRKIKRSFPRRYSAELIQTRGRRVDRDVMKELYNGSTSSDPVHLFEKEVQKALTVPVTEVNRLKRMTVEQNGEIKQNTFHELIYEDSSARKLAIASYADRVVWIEVFKLVKTVAVSTSFKTVKEAVQAYKLGRIRWRAHTPYE